MSDHPRLASRLGAAAFGTMMMVGLAGPVAAENLYPPTLPGPTQTTAPGDTEVAGARVTRSTPARDEVRDARLAVTGADALPYAAGAAALVVGGVGILLVTRRPRRNQGE